MGYEEYKKLFDKCQKTAPYHLFIYDLVKSREIEDRAKAQSDIAKLLFSVYDELGCLEKTINKKILYKSDDLYYGKLKYDNGIYMIDYQMKDLIRADLFEPFLLTGDMMGFTIVRGSLNSAQVDYIFEKNKKELGMNYLFHKANGFYETDKWEEANKNYFRGYCIQQLEESSKKKNKDYIEIER